MNTNFIDYDCYVGYGYGYGNGYGSGYGNGYGYGFGSGNGRSLNDLKDFKDEY